MKKKTLIDSLHVIVRCGHVIVAHEILWFTLDPYKTDIRRSDSRPVE